MSVFIVMKHVEYEGSWLLGLYSSQEKGMDACVRYHRDQFADHPEIRDRVWNWHKREREVEAQPGTFEYFTVQQREIDEDEDL